MVAGHACIRVQKMALPLIQRGHEVHLIAGKVPSFWPSYKSFSLCSDIDQYQAAIRLHPNADVFHCHNEPSWFASAVKEVFPNKPVLMDVHDSYLARYTPEEVEAKQEKGEFAVRVTVEERNNFQIADALNFPGDAFAEIVRGEFKLTQPHMVLPSYVPSHFYKYDQKEWLGGLVYEGKVNTPEETSGRHFGFEYCDYTDVMNRCATMNMDFHLYAGRNDDKFKEHFKKAYIHKPLEYDVLMKEIGKHDWGLVGNSIKTREWEVAAPNKLFEYMATGVPVVSMNAGWCSKFVKDNDVGIEVSGPEELGQRWAEHRAKRTNVIKRRREFSMDAHINKLEDFYRGLAC